MRTVKTWGGRVSFSGRWVDCPNPKNGKGGGEHASRRRNITIKEDGFVSLSGEKHIHRLRELVEKWVEEKKKGKRQDGATGGGRGKCLAKRGE